MLGDASYRISENFATERFGEGLEKAAQAAINRGRKKFGMIDRALLFAGARYEH